MSVEELSAGFGSGPFAPSSAIEPVFEISSTPVGSGESTVTAKVAARLDESPNPDLSKRSYTKKPYWHLERSRVGTSRKVPFEVLVNGYPVARREITADGSELKVSFDVPIERSSWIALRILPSSHTNPIFVLVGDKPIRASRRSAEWCLKSVDRCWDSKESRTREAERPAAKAAYDVARAAYRRILRESEAD